MSNISPIKENFKATRKWIEMELAQMHEVGLTDLSYRPRTGMSALGWVLAHQAMVMDFSLNILIKGRGPAHPTLLASYRPGTAGEWGGETLEEIQQVYDRNEHAFLEWLDSASDQDMTRVLSGEKVPEFFRGMTVLEAIASMFSHLNCHTGHLAAIRRDWMQTRDG